jgi:hypothetical protein
MKLKYFNLGVVEAGLWGIGMGLFISLSLGPGATSVSRLHEAYKETHRTDSALSRALGF